MSSIPDIRIRPLNDASIVADRDFVLYWMIGSRRLHWNWALERAIDFSERLDKPLVILEPLDVSYPWASDRHHRAILDAMQEHAEALAGSPVTYYPYVEPEKGAGRGLVSALAERACVVVTDDTPVFFLPKVLEAAGGIDHCLVEAVDGCGLFPIREAGKPFTSAFHLRRFLHKRLPDHFGSRPAPDPLQNVALSELKAIPPEILERWPRASNDMLTDPRALSSLPIDHDVAPTGWTGGHAAARERLDDFLENDLHRYAEERNDPDAGAASGLSPWLHYGHISPHEVFVAVAESEGWSPARISGDPNGRRSGWWGMSDSAESFLDELITWRELGYIYCTYAPDYAEYETLPAWALATLEEHADDSREYVYTLDEFAQAETHDELWNAAQRELVRAGTIHNYLRMLWGKKILEWTEHPKDALRIMIELNNRYALDGRDPNSYSGIFWVLGRFDRGWPERDIFGKVRYMTSASTRRKVDVDRYLERWGAAREEAAV